MTIEQAVIRRESFSRRVIPGVLVAAALLAGCSSPPQLEAFSNAASIASRARMLEAEGDQAGAAAAYEDAAVQATSAGERAQYLLLAGECSLRCGDTSRAWVNLSESLAGLEELSPSSPARASGVLRANAGLGDLDLRAGRHANARVHYLQALEVARHDARDSILYRLMVLAETTGDAAEATRYRDRIVRWDSPAVTELQRVMPANSRNPRDRSRLRSSEPVAAAIPMFRSRADWAAQPSGSNFDPMGRPYRITVHHTGDLFTSTAQSDASDTIHRIQRHHMNNNGWADIGYHYLIDPAGRIWQGRMANQQGAHAGNPALNRGNLGIALMGNFSAQSLPRAQEAALESLLVNLMTRHGIPIHDVYSHQTIRPDPTECPGRDLSRHLPDILKRVNSRVLRAQAGSSARPVTPDRGP